MTPEGEDGEVLIFVEDPGAANYAARLPVVLRRFGLDATLFAAEPARQHVLEWGVRDVEEGHLAASRLHMGRPAALVVGTSENSDSPAFSLVRQARLLQVPTLGLVGAAANAEHRFRGRSQHPLAHAPDWLAVPDHWTQGRFVDLGFPPNRVVVCGHPHHDEVRESGQRLAALAREELRGRLFPGLRPGRPVLVFAAEISAGLGEEQYRRGDDYLLSGRGGSEGRTEIVVEELLEAVTVLVSRPYLVLRLHPKNRPGDLAEQSVEFDVVSHVEPVLELLHASDAVVGMTSTILAEAALLGRPTLSIVPRRSETGWVPQVEGVEIPVATTRAEVRSQLRELLVRAGEVGRTPAPVSGTGAAEAVALLVRGIAEANRSRTGEERGWRKH